MGYRSAEHVEDDVCIYQPLYVLAVEKRRVQRNLSREWGGQVSEAEGGGETAGGDEL
jgi:hypothetical protein